MQSKVEQQQQQQQKKHNKLLQLWRYCFSDAVKRNHNGFVCVLPEQEQNDFRVMNFDRKQ